MEGSAPLPKNAIVLTALQELVLSDSKKVYSASNPAFHRGTTSILYRTLSSKQLPQNQHGVLRCPCQYSNPMFFCCRFLHPFTPDIHTQCHKRRHHKRCIFQPLSFIHLDIFFLHGKKGENGFLIKGLEPLLTAYCFCSMHCACCTRYVNFLYV